MDSNWISVKDKLPNTPGWYKVMTNKHNEVFEVPYVSTLNGQLVWVFPDPNIIIKWLQK